VLHLRPAYHVKAVDVADPWLRGWKAAHFSASHNPAKGTSPMQENPNTCNDPAAPYGSTKAAQEADALKAQLNQQEHIVQFFTFEHLPQHLQIVSAPFQEVAQFIVNKLPRNPERTVALRKLLEAKDAAVRAALAK